jgi:hypothetical protein
MAHDPKDDERHFNTGEVGLCTQVQIHQVRALQITINYAYDRKHMLVNIPGFIESSQV